MDDKIIATFCLCDDLLKVMHHQEDGQCQMNDAEIMTTVEASITASATCVHSEWCQSPRIPLSSRVAVFVPQPDASVVIYTMINANIIALKYIKRLLFTHIEHLTFAFF